MINDVNLNLLKYFYEVVNYGNITKASEMLFVSQPAITKSIKELENQLNAQLLIRNKTGVVPTKEGEILFNNIKETFASLNSAINTIEKTRTEKTLYIGATTTNFLEFIVKELDLFKKLHPDVFIDIKFDNINNLQDRAKLGKLDIVIKNSYESLNNFEKIKSFEVTDKFVASKKAYAHFKDKTVTLDELLSEPFVLLSNKSHGRQNFNAYLKQQNKTLKPKYEFDSHSLCRELIRNGFGIGIGNPVHYKSKDFLILNTDFYLPTRLFDIGYITNAQNSLIAEFTKLFK